MNFDKSRVYTTLNAEELRIGSKVIVADNLLKLKKFVSEDVLPKTIEKIEPEGMEYRFTCNGGWHYLLAYLVEEPEELKWTNLKVGDVITDGKRFALVTEIDEKPEDGLPVYAGNKWLSEAMLAGWTKIEE